MISYYIHLSLLAEFWTKVRYITGVRRNSKTVTCGNFVSILKSYHQLKSPYLQLIITINLLRTLYYDSFYLISSVTATIIAQSEVGTVCKSDYITVSLLTLFIAYMYDD